MCFQFLIYSFRKNKTKRVTRVEMNRRARRKERLRAEAEEKKMESISKEIDR
jgi:nucleolar protein 53